MAWSPHSGNAYVIGVSFSAPGTRTFYNVIDTTTGASVETLSLDRFTPAGLAEVPEPSFAAGLGLTCAVLAALRRRRP
jgi:hypothetical protein